MAKFSNVSFPTMENVITLKKDLFMVEAYNGKC